MRNLLNKIIGIFKWIWKRPEVQEILTEAQQQAWIDLKSIAFTAIAEAKAGNFTSGEEKRVAAYNRIYAYARNKGMSYSKSIINWTIEHAYQRFAPEV